MSQWQKSKTRSHEELDQTGVDLIHSYWLRKLTAPHAHVAAQIKQRLKDWAQPERFMDVHEEFPERYDSIQLPANNLPLLDMEDVLSTLLFWSGTWSQGSKNSPQGVF